MAAYHDAAIETAEKTLNPGQSMMYQFKTPEQAHKEYMSLNRALKRDFAVAKYLEPYDHWKLEEQEVLWYWKWKKVE